MVGAENRIVWEITDFSIYPTVIFVMFLLVGLNLILRRFLKRISFSGTEMATVYTLIIAMMVAGLVGAIASFGTHLGFYYRYSGYAVWGRDPYNRLGNWLVNPVIRDATAIKQMSFGFLFTVSLMIMSRRYLWWPFHPVGYAVGAGWAMGYMWFSVFISWLAKKLILAYGGSKIYRAAIPFFLGLILGQFFMGSLWSVIGLVVNRNMYTLFP